MKRIKIYTILVAVIILALVASFFAQKIVRQQRTDAAVVKEIRALNRWETSSYSIEKIIDSGSEGNLFQKLLFGNRILLVAHGEVTGGFDLSSLSDSSVKTNGKSITINLPAPQILSTRLDESQTRVYDRQKGILVPSDNNLESDARLQAVTAIHDASCTQGILNITSDNAKKQLTSILSSFGFTDIVINIAKGSC